MKYILGFLTEAEQRNVLRDFFCQYFSDERAHELTEKVIEDLKKQ